MTELIKYLSSIPDVYDDFVYGVISYAMKNSAHIKVLNDYMNDNPDVTTSDVVRFISMQPDFHDYSANAEHVMVG